MADLCSIYIHVPFCNKLCPYCGFYKRKWDRDSEEKYLSALLSEIHFYGQRFPFLKVGTIFWGGGTPNLLRMEGVERVMSALLECFDVSIGAEITMEMNPGMGVLKKLKAIQKTGINRVSLGVQSFDEEVLRFLGRNHTADVTRRTIDRVRECGFDSMSLDLMFALPGFHRDVLECSINEVLSYQPEHVSAYSLSIEPGTPFKRQSIKKAAVKEDRAQFELVRDTLGAAGLRHYEVSNFAIPGYESAHNTQYWMGLPFIGLGPGAHSYFNGGRYHHARDLSAYIDSPVPRVFRQKQFPSLSKTDEWQDFVMMRLRLLKGLGFSEIEARFGAEQLTDFRRRLQPLISQGFVIQDTNGIRLSVDAVLVLDDIILSLFS